MAHVHAALMLIYDKMFIAVELNDDGLVNDMGTIAPTKEKAWDIVKDIFSLRDTQIWELVPRFNVKAPSKVKFVRLDLARTDDEWDNVG